jgi:hypothetical protein
MHERLLTERCQQEVEITPRRPTTHCGPRPIHRGIDDLMIERYSHTVVPIGRYEIFAQENC